MNCTELEKKGYELANKFKPKFNKLEVHMLNYSGKESEIGELNSFFNGECKIYLNR